MTYPIVFISYDEANANDHYNYLLKTLGPQVLRVHGVKGFDTAHKRAARLVLEGTPYATHFFTIDGDNLLMVDEFQKLCKALEAGERPSSLIDHVLSWRAINTVNGLCYGNGGLKLWPVQWVLNMKTHEATDGEKIDFCWDDKYTQLTAIMSWTRPDGSKYQAWRSGFREGVKMSLFNGQLQDRYTIAEQVAQINTRRFIHWASLGRDTPLGDWVVYGAAQGFHHANANQGVKDVIDYDRMKALFQKFIDDYLLADAPDQLFEYSPAVTLQFAELRRFARSFNIEIPAYGALQSYTAKLLMSHTQTPFFEVETWKPGLPALPSVKSST